MTNWGKFEAVVAVTIEADEILVSFGDSLMDDDNAGVNKGDFLEELVAKGEAFEEGDLL
jgi:hypothetical protein